MDAIKFPIHHILPVLSWNPAWAPPSPSIFIFSLFLYLFFLLQYCSICWLMRGCNWTHPSWLGQVMYLSLTHPLSFSLLLTACLQPHVLIEPQKKWMSNFLPLVCTAATSQHLLQDLQFKNEIAEPRARHHPSFHQLCTLVPWRISSILYHTIGFCILVGVMWQLVGPP